MHRSFQIQHMIILAMAVLVAVLGFQNRILQQRLRDWNLNSMIPTVGSWVPVLQERTLNGRSINIGESGEKYQFIYIFRPGCPHCEASNSAIKKFASELNASDQQVEFIGVSESDPATAASYVKSEGFSFDVVPIVDARSIALLHAELVPTVLLTNNLGKVVYAHSGELHGVESYRSMSSQILTVLHGSRSND